MRGNASPAKRSGSKRLFNKWAILTLAAAPSVALAAAGPTPPPAQEVKNQAFDWFVNSTPGYLPSPFLSDQSANDVNAFLQTLPADQPKAVKVQGPISNQTASLIFNNPAYRVSYVLGDLESPSAVADVTQLARQVRFVNGQNNGTKTQSHNAFIGNFGFTTIPNDKTLPQSYTATNKDQHSFAGFSRGNFMGAKLNMSMAEVYSGSSSFRTPAAGNSSAPNIRSAMFTLPALRVAQVEVHSSADQRNVPWVARFNNWGNLALDTDRDASNKFTFETGQAIPARNGLPAVSAADTTDQLLSRRDFATLVAHERLRGADSYALFEPGVVGYTNEQKRNDAKAGWTQPNIDNVFQASDYKLLLGKELGKGDKDINDTLVVDGKRTTAEASGAIFSGVYSLSLETLDIVLSNMDDVEHTLTLPKSIGGYDLKTNSFTLDQGSHLLVEYKLQTSGVNKGWSIALQQVPLEAIDNSRHGFGIPEPSTITLAAVTGFFLVGRRRRASNAR